MNSFRQLFAVYKKEIIAAFGSPLAAIFIASFLLLNLFQFFWVEGFCDRIKTSGQIENHKIVQITGIER